MKFTLGNFYLITVDNTQPINDTHAIGTSGANLGRLIIHTVTVAVNGTTTGYADLTAAFTAIGTQAGDFTVTLKENQTMTENRTVSAAGQNITIVGESSIRTIDGSNFDAATTMFSINNATASLTLGNNVTIQGRTTAGSGNLIFLSGTFRMLEGSRITGHQVSSASSAAVYIGSGGLFEMSGGSIDGNNNTAAETNTNVTSGVSLAGGTFTMTGGSITGNTHSGEASDVYHENTSANRLTMSGNAQIGALKLNATSTTAGATVAIGAGGWNGSITTLNLRGGITAIGTASGYWINSTRIIFIGITASPFCITKVSCF
jgi:hypothetical protein